MENSLVIITREFPYGSAESFLEAEIVVLARYFQNITIYPLRKGASMRVLPNNVEVDKLMCDGYQSKNKWIVKTLLSSKFYKTVFKYFLVNPTFSSIKTSAKYCTSTTMYDALARELYKSRSMSLVYSYWYSSVVDSFLNEKPIGTKLICRVHGGDLYEAATLAGFFPHRDKNIHKIDQIFSISQNGVDHLNKKFNTKQVKLSRLGVYDLGIINKPSQNNQFNLVSVSNVIPVKRVELIQQVVKQYALENPAIQVSWNHFGDGNQLENVKEIVEKKTVSNLVCTFHGRLPNKDIFEYYAQNSVDVFINLSKSEGIPVSIMEAISFGIPIVATDVGGTAEIVNAVNGFLVKADSTVSEIVTCLNALQKLPKNREQIRDNWKRNYSAEQNYSEFAMELLALNPQSSAILAEHSDCKS